MRTSIILLSARTEQVYNNDMGLNVLIVDDAPFIRDILRQILTKSGHVVVGEAEDGEQAVRLALELKPQIVIMDIVMPRKSGVEAIKEIVSLIPEIKIMACSTVDQEIMLMKAMEAGAHDFIHKPFHAKDLAKRIEALGTNPSGGKL
jgi:two-component system, chemotaxis family, chemotaxis protein CheY